MTIGTNAVLEVMVDLDVLGGPVLTGEHGARGSTVCAGRVNVVRDNIVDNRRAGTTGDNETSACLRLVRAPLAPVRRPRTRPPVSPV